MGPRPRIKRRRGLSTAPPTPCCNSTKRGNCSPPCPTLFLCVTVCASCGLGGGGGGCNGRSLHADPHPAPAPTLHKGQHPFIGYRYIGSIYRYRGMERDVHLDRYVYRCPRRNSVWPTLSTAQKNLTFFGTWTSPLYLSVYLDPLIPSPLPTMPLSV